MPSFSKVVIAQLLTFTASSARYDPSSPARAIHAFCSSGSRNCRSLFGHQHLTTSTKNNLLSPSSSSITTTSSSTLKSILDNSHLSSIKTTATTMDSFSTYLSSKLPNYIQSLLLTYDETSHHAKKVNFIMGNQAGDADSIISSLALSYVKQMEQATKINEVEESLLTVPIICVEKDDLSLRQDVISLLQLAGITKTTHLESLLYFNDDLYQSIVLNSHSNRNEEENIKKNTKIKSFTLVDHNKIRSELLSQFQHDVIEIYDHHQDEGCHLDSCMIREIAFKNQKATVGSTCTIVTEKIIHMFAASAKTATSVEQPTKIDGALGLALLGVILLDTMNMNPSADKGTPRDEKAIQYLIANSDWDNILENTSTKKVFMKNNDGQMIPDRERLFKYLNESKFDQEFWKGMNTRDALRIDYKRFEPKTTSYDEEGCNKKRISFGLSSVLLDASMILSKPNFYDNAIEYMNEVKIDLLGVLCMVIVDGSPRREMIMIGKPDQIMKVIEYLQKDSSATFLDISLVEEYEEKETYVMKRFNQGNPKGSRKQIAPVLLSFFSQNNR